MNGLVPEQKISAKPRSILFLCGMNAIRSPMAEAIAKSVLPSDYFISSAGVQKGEPDPFVAAILSERGLPLQDYEPQALEDLDDDYFDLIVALSQEAFDRAVELARSQAVEVEFWPLPDPSGSTGTRDQILEQYRLVRDTLETHIHERFTVANSKQTA